MTKRLIELYDHIEAEARKRVKKMESRRTRTTSSGEVILDGSNKR